MPSFSDHHYVRREPMSLCRLARLGIACLLLSASLAHAETSQQRASHAEIQIVVRSENGPIPRAQVVISGITTETDAEGRATLQVVPGPVDITVVKEGFNPVTIRATATLDQ